MDKPASRPTQALAAVIGSALEWYDFTIFGYFILIISRLFFPGGKEYESLLLTTAIFGAGFFMRPIGAVVLGRYSDRKGRKAALQLVIFLMTLAVTMMAFSPTYATIGIAAPIIIALARLLQSFSAAGEFASCTAFLIEIAPSNKRGFYGSLVGASIGLSSLFAAIVGTLLTGLLTTDQINGWGWRLPFLIGLLIGPVGMFIRRRAQETEAFKIAIAKSTKKIGFKELFKDHHRALLVSFALMACMSIGSYTIQLYMPIFANTQLGLSLNDGFVALMISIMFNILACILFGWLSDRLGRRSIIMTCIIISFFVIYFLFYHLIKTPSFSNLLLVEVVIGILNAAVLGTASTAMAEQFPTSLRSTGLAITTNLAVMTFAGPSLFFITWLIKILGSPMAPAYYMMFGLILGFLAVVFLKDRHKEQALR